MRFAACALGFLVFVPAPQPVSAGQGTQTVIMRDAQQPEKTGSARLSGRVTAADTGRPLRRVVVRASSPDMPQGRSISTDADGRWELRSLPAARYTLHLSKGGYVNLAYGQRRPFEAGTGIEVADGQVIDKLDVSLPRAGAITGIIVDEFGDPVTGARVTAMRHRHVAGQRRLMAMGPGDTTDDIGQYRLHGLPPGDYYVAAAMMGGLMIGQSDDRVGYAQTLYPGTAVQAEAERVSITEGQEAPQVNFAMAPTRVATISGTAVNSSGRPISRGMLTLISTSPGGMQTALATMLRPDGSFTHSNVAPGDYRLQVRDAPSLDNPMAGGIGGAPVIESASLALTVTGEDITGIALVTAPGAVASGRVRFEGGATPTASAASTSIGAVPLEMGLMMMGGTGRVRDDWTFEVTGLSDRRRFRVNTPPPGWYLKAVIHDGQDITDSGMEFREGQQVSDIEIVLTARVTELAGSVRDSAGKPVEDYAVVAFSPDSAKWGFQSRFVRMMRPNQDGRFSIKDLPADDYLIVALDYLEPGEEGDPEQLEKWRAGATSVALAEGESKSLTLRLAR